ncbi:MAG: peptidoglycan DD-metalloendopeptidase family protein, partial [Terricaulis silvestris]
WACAAMAGAAPATDAAKLEKRQAAESRKAKELTAKAASASARVSDLSANLAGIGGAKAATDAARAEASAHLAAVQGKAASDASDLTDARNRLELLLIRFLQDEPAASAGLIGKPGPGATVASFFTSALTDRVADKRTRIAEAEAALVEIASRRQELDGRAEALARQGAQTAEQMAAAARERDRLQAEAEAANARAASLARQARDLRDLAARATAAQKTAHQPKIIAVAPGGKRFAPAPGAILTAFNGPTKTGPALGVTLRTAAGAKVVAPAEGTVTFSGPFRSFGKVLILDQGNGYAVILTGLESVFAGIGDKIAAGALIGQMGQTKADGATTAPELYFEVRQAGRPIDPERWLKPAG